MLTVRLTIAGGSVEVWKQKDGRVQMAIIPFQGPSSTALFMTESEFLSFAQSFGALMAAWNKARGFDE